MEFFIHIEKRADGTRLAWIASPSEARDSTVRAEYLDDRTPYPAVTETYGMLSRFAEESVEAASFEEARLHWMNDYISSALNESAISEP